MKSFAVSAGVLIYVAGVITFAMRVSPSGPAIQIRTVQTIHIDPDDEYERGIQ